MSMRSTRGCGSFGRGMPRLGGLTQPDSRADYSEAGQCKQGNEEAWSRDPSESQGGSGLIQSKVRCEIV
jgi:hypothetical protein